MSTSLSRLQSFYGALKVPLLLHAVIKREFPGSIALIGSPTTPAALLLSLVADIDPATPVLFAGALSPETLGYARSLVAQLHLTDVRWLKTEPLAQAADRMGLLALITSRTRTGLSRIALDAHGVFHINPLIGRTKEELENEMIKRNISLPPLAGLDEIPEPGEYEMADADSMPATEWSV